MAKYSINDTTLSKISNPIKTLMGLSAGLTPEQMAAQLGNANTDVTNAMAELRKKGVTQTGNLPDIASLVAKIDCGGEFVKVGSLTCGYQETSISLKNYSRWAELTVDDIYMVPTAFTITQDGTITGGTYNVIKRYVGGTLYTKRDPVPGQVGLNFAMDVYVYLPL